MIEVRGLTKRYGELAALRDVSLEVAAGEMCVVLGPSGAGKSTLLRCHQPPDRADRGRGRDRRQPRSARPPRAARGAPPGRHDLPGPQPGAAPVGAQERADRAPVATCRAWRPCCSCFPRATCDIALSACGASSWTTAPGAAPTGSPAGSSSAWASRARWRSSRGLILADEPVASLDPKTARVVLDDLRRAAHELGIAVLCNLHQVEYALRVRRSHRRHLRRRGGVRGHAGGARRGGAAPHLSGPGERRRSSARSRPRASTHADRSCRMSRFRFLLGGAWTLGRTLQWLALLLAAPRRAGLERARHRVQRRPSW